jgi:CubicO group peptidase (beta-lactamase class C family)
MIDRYKQCLAMLFVALSITQSLASAQPLPTAPSPESVGLSSTQLDRIEAVTRAHIEAGILPGAVMLIAREGKVAWSRVLGYQDKSKNQPMSIDSLFRIYSMTKPIVSVAIMMLVEEGKLQITDPVSKYIPEFKETKVGVEKIGTNGETTIELSLPRRQVTIQDLLRHTSGLTYGNSGKSLVHKTYLDARIGDRSVYNHEFARRVAGLPLRFSPGTQWEYGVSTDVLGRVIEVVTDKPLSTALSERIFQPLEMKDTSFHLPAAKLSRAAQPSNPPDGRPLTPRFNVEVQPAFESGGAGLISSTEDYLRFTLMLLNSGVYGDKRLLGKQTIDFMISDHVGAIPGRPPGLGFGLGFEVRTTTGFAGLPGSSGEYGWAGNAGTLFWIDPKNKLIALYMVQVNEDDRIALRNQFRSMVQAAIIN